MNTNTKRPLFLISIDAKTRYDRLVTAKIGDVVTYDEMEASLGRTVRGNGAWILASARRKAFTQNSMLFGAVPKVGLKRLNDSEIVDSAHDSITRVHRLSARAGRHLSAVQDYDSLPAQYKTRFNLNASALAFLNHVTKEQQMKKLQEKVEKSSRTLPLQRTLEAFKE